MHDRQHARRSIPFTTLDGRFYYVNDAKCRSLGYTREELLELKTSGTSTRKCHRERWRAIFQNLKEKGFLKVETMHRAKDGRTFPTEIWTTYLNFHGSEYVCAFVRDITERKQVEKSLKLTQFTMDRAGEMICGWPLMPGTSTQPVRLRDFRLHAGRDDRDDHLRHLPVLDGTELGRGTGRKSKSEVRLPSSARSVKRTAATSRPKSR